MLAVLLLSICCYAHQAICDEPNPPQWPSSVYVFMPGNDEYTQEIIDKVFAENGGQIPADNGQWSNSRFAFLFQPGVYNVTVNVGYYTTVMGLGASPADTDIGEVTVLNGNHDGSVGALNNFWRSAENFMTTPKAHDGAMVWAVSQGVSLRRVIVNGNLTLDDAGGFASGGYLSNSHVSGIIDSGSQQQWYTRNVYTSHWEGGSWNFCWQGVVNAPSPQCQNKSSSLTRLASTPVIAEKPFISLIDGRYWLMVPPIEHNKVGPTDFSATPAQLGIDMIDFSRVYVTDASRDTAQTINAKLAQGLHLVLTAGNYYLTDALYISAPDTVVLGVGYPTLMSMQGNAVIEVADGVSHARISGVLMQAGPLKTDVLLQFGSTTGAPQQGSHFLYDIFARIGGPNDPSIQQWQTDVIVRINSDNVVLDNSWLWRADHDVTGGPVYDGQNPCLTGLIINGDNVVSYSLKVEHTLRNLVQWNGHNGSTYFYQSEFPYDGTQKGYGDQGYSAFEVNASINTFQGYAMGMYCFFRDENVTVHHAISAPVKDGVQFTNILTVFIAGGGGIEHVINSEGAPVNLDWRDTPSMVCSFPE